MSERLYSVISTLDIVGFTHGNHRTAHLREMIRNGFLTYFLNYV